MSVPANELRSVDVPGSLFEAAQLNQMGISEPLKRACSLISTLCKEPLCVVRPEIFTHGRARSWLDNRLGAITNHICLSDGTAVKLIGGLENYVFFYELRKHKSSAGLKNLLNWAPELFTNIRSQINTFHGALLKGRLVQPPTTLTLPETRYPAPPAEFYEFFLDPRSLQECARLIVDKGVIPDPPWASFKELIYVPFSESSTCDPAFCRLLAQAIATAYFDPDQCVILRLPILDENADLVHQVVVSFEAILSSGVMVPAVPARNIFLVRSDLPESFFDAYQQVSLVLDDTFDFWRYTSTLYRNLHSLRYLLGGDRRKLQAVLQGLTKLLGRPPIIKGALPAATPIVLTWAQEEALAVGNNDD